MEKDFYLNVGRASEITDKKERRFYRFLEIFPGLLSWLTLFLVILFSLFFPFIIITQKLPKVKKLNRIHRLWPYRLVVRTTRFQCVNGGPIPPRAT